MARFETVCNGAAERNNIFGTLHGLPCSECREHIKDMQRLSPITKSRRNRLCRSRRAALETAGRVSAWAAHFRRQADQTENTSSRLHAAVPGARASSCSCWPQRPRCSPSNFTKILQRRVVAKLTWPLGTRIALLPAVRNLLAAKSISGEPSNDDTAFFSGRSFSESTRAEL